MGLPWSYSAYSAATRCLRLYKLSYLDKEAPDYTAGDLVFGSALHSAINGVLTGEDGAALFEIYWMSYKTKEIEYGRHGWEALAELGTKFIKNFTKLHAPKYKLEFAEERLKAEYQGTKLEGTLDFLGLYDGKRSLRDFKTAGSAYAKEKADTALQLNLYAYLANENGKGYPETLGYSVFNKGTGCIQQLTWGFDVNKMFDMLDSVTAYCTMVDKQDGYPRNFNSCLDYNKKCSYWSKCHGGKDENGI